ncbi:MAG TPA: ABC transporter permease [Candidatus Binatus sp.]|nr:ABC transporter permease [Candidatus Binatus sp.]HWY22024.1 ABC transporter permease [Candidatus Acidoferrum sp.]
MRTLRQNARYSIRLLRKNPGFTLIAAVTLALGIGANTAIFSVIYAVLLAPMPYPEPDQLVMVWSHVQGSNNVVAAGDYLDWKQQNKAFQDLNAWSGANFNFATPAQPEQINGSAETPGFLHMTGNAFLLGRDFSADEGQPGKEHEVILMHRLWEHLGGDRNIIGKTIQMNSEPYTVVGVLAAGQSDRLDAQFVVPLAFKPDQINHDFHWLLVMGRMKPGVSLAQAQADMEVVTNRIAQDHPQSNKGWGISVEQLHNDFFPKEAKQTLWLLMGGVGFLLLIACGNVANLVLAKGTTRLKEVAVRTSLGASRWQVFSQFLTESLVLAVLGGGLGIGLGLAIIRIMMAKMPPSTLPSEADVTLNLPVLFFTLAATTIAGILFGCAPAWHASRIDPNETLKEGGRSGTSAGRHRLLRSLVIGEFALALTMLAGAGLAIHSFWNLARVDPGFRIEHLLTFNLPVPEKRFTQPEQIVTYYRQLVERIESLPGVVRAEAGTGMPLQGTNFGMPFMIVGTPPLADPSARPGAGFQMVTPGFFQTFGIQMVKGRAFTDQDTATGVRVAVVNETFVKRYFSGVDPLSQRILVEQLIPGVPKLGPPLEWQIVGVFRNVHNGGLRGDGFPEIDVPFAQSPWPQTSMAVRTTGDPAQMSKSIAAAVHTVDPDLALANVKTMDQIVNESLVRDQFVTALYVSFASVALLLAAVGIYGVMAFAVAQRTHEIGLRMALGASQDHVLGLILKEGIVLASIGLGLGLVGACFVGRAMRGVLYGVGTIDVAAFSAVAFTLFIAALFACYLPANKAAKVDPMVALRYE